MTAMTMFIAQKNGTEHCLSAVLSVCPYPTISCPSICFIIQFLTYLYTPTSPLPLSYPSSVYLPHPKPEEQVKLCWSSSPGFETCLRQLARNLSNLNRVPLHITFQYHISWCDWHTVKAVKRQILHPLKPSPLQPRCGNDHYIREMITRSKKSLQCSSVTTGYSLGAMSCQLHCTCN